MEINIDFLTSKLKDGNIRIKLKYLRVLLTLYCENGVIKTDFMEHKRELHLRKIIKHFGASLINEEIHGHSKVELKRFDILNSEKLEEFLSSHIDLNAKTYLGFQRVLNPKLYKHEQPSAKL